MSTADEPIEAGRWYAAPAEREPIKVRRSDDLLRIGVLWPAAVSAGDGPEIGDPAVTGRLAGQLERLGIDYVVVPEHRHGSGATETEATTPAAQTAVDIIVATQTIGVVTAQRTSYVHPVHLARTGAHLDWMSAGRWGAWVDPSRSITDDRLYGVNRPVSDPFERAAHAALAVETIWTTPLGTPVEIDGPFRIHGKVKGPAPIQHPPFALVVESGIAGIDLAVRVADHYAAAATSHDELANVARQVAEGARPSSRPDPVRVLARVIVHVGPTGADELARSRPTARDAALVATGAPDEVAAELTSVAAVPGVGGMILDLLDCSERGIDELAFVLDRLRTARTWRPAFDRGFRW